LDLTIVIVSYQVRERLMECLKSLDGLDRERFETVVVDNASNDGTMAELPRQFPWVRFLAMDRNTGFAMACNRGVQVAQAPWILFLNPDTVVFPQTLAKVLEFAGEHERAGIVGCRILDGEGNLQLACRRSIPTPAVAFWRLSGLSLLFPRNRHFARYNLTYLDPAKDSQVEAVSGSFLMMRTDVFRSLGGFDEDFFLYGEDLDLCLRTARQGWEIWYCGGATVIHHKGQSAATRPLGARWNFYHAMVIFAVKNFGVGKIGRWLLEGAALALTSAEMLARRFEAVRTWALDLVLANVIFFALSTVYLWIRLHAFYLSLGPKAWGWHVALSVWLLLGMGGAGLYCHRVASNLGKLLVGLSASASAFLVTGFFFKNAVYSRAAFLLSMVGVSAMLLARHLHRRLNVAKGPRRILVLGVGDASKKTLERLRQWPKRFQVLGYVDAEAENGRPREVLGDMPIAELSSLEPMVKALEVDALVLPASQASALLPRLPSRLPGLRVFVEVEAGNGPPLLGDVTLDRTTIAGGQ